MTLSPALALRPHSGALADVTNVIATDFESNAAPSLRAGIICSGEILPFWQAETIRELGAVSGVTLDCVVLEAADAPRGKSGQPALWRHYRQFAGRLRGARCLQPVDLTDMFPGLSRLTCRTTMEGSRRNFAAADVAQIARRQLDVIIDFGEEPACGDVLAAARHGVWSFQPGHGRCGPIGFWEIYRNEPLSSLVLQRTGRTAAETAVIREGAARTIAESYSRNLDQLLLGAKAWPALAARLLLQGQNDEVFRSAPGDAATTEPPTNRDMVAHVLGLARKQAQRHVDDLFGYSQSGPDEWAIGITSQTVASMMAQNAPAPVRWLVAPEGRYFADPFVVTRGRSSYIFVEDYDRHERRGHIAVIETGDFRSFSQARPVIEQAFHLSYPCVFVHEDRCYCVPEQHQSGEVAIYEAATFPDGWIKRATLLDGFAGVDPTVFRHANRWWMFLTNRANDDVSELYLFYADHPLGPWTAHRRNPVKSDKHKVRPAGMPLYLNGSLIRPSQDCSRTYGGRIELHRIKRLSTSDFSEELLGTIEARPDWPYSSGLHTVNLTAGVTVFDAKRRTMVRNDLRKALRRKAGSVLIASGLRQRRTPIPAREPR